MLPENRLEDISEEKKAYKAFKIDFEKKTTGEIIDGREAMEQAVKMALTVQRYRYPAFSHYYGTDYEGLLEEGEDKAMGKLKNAICDSLGNDERITAVDNFSFERKGSSMLVKFRVVSIYGEMENEIEVS